MLNEVIEREEYTSSEKEMAVTKRLKNKGLIRNISLSRSGKNSINGLRRPLTILARYCIFESYPDLKDGQVMECVRKTKMYLKAWLGKESEESIELSEDIIYKKMNGWFQKYLYINILEEKLTFVKYNLKIEESDSKETCDTLLDEIQRTDLTFDKKLDSARALIKIIENDGNNQTCRDNLLKVIRIMEAENAMIDYRLRNSSIKANSNDINKYSYDQIISNAFEKGPLKRYYLVCDKDEIKDIKKISKNHSDPHNCKELTRKMKKYDSEMDRVLKLTAAVLLSKSNDMDCTKQFVHVNWTDIGNWTVNQTESDDLKRLYYNNQPLFEVRTMGKKAGSKNSKGNLTTIRMNKKWMEDYNWRLVYEEDFCPSCMGDKLYYSDLGSGSYLQCRKPYPRSSSQEDKGS